MVDKYLVGHVPDGQTPVWTIYPGMVYTEEMDTSSYLGHYLMPRPVGFRFRQA